MGKKEKARDVLVERNTLRAVIHNVLDNTQNEDKIARLTGCQARFILRVAHDRLSSALAKCGGGQ